MHVFYEEEGTFKVGTVLADNDASLQVEAPHGKRSKIKAANVLLRFETPAAAALLDGAQRASADIDLDFLWQCCGEDEFGFEALGREYYGHAPSTLESAALLIRLHNAPMYFYKKGKGRYKAAPEASLKAALASVEKKRLQEEQKQQWLAELKAGVFPEAFVPLRDTLLYAPDKNSLEWKTFDAACVELKLTPAQLCERCGALKSPFEFHYRHFLFMWFPRGISFEAGVLSEIKTPALDDLPLANVQAFSIDDAETTEIDDAFSVTTSPDGNTRIGIHIAAPALGITPASALDEVARKRLSTVYFPGQKITMLPNAAVSVFTLAEKESKPALSLYADVNVDGLLTAVETKVERVPIAANLRLQDIEPVFNAQTVNDVTIAHAYGTALKQLWQIATKLEIARGKVEQAGDQRPEYSFYVEGEGENERIRIVPRLRGSPIDKVVSELMIYANSTWGKQLAEAGVAAIYRAQTNGGQARMTIKPAPHEGLGVGYYTWASSPLRRYVDLINQRQIISLASNTDAPYSAKEPALQEALRDFELAYDAYAEFQRQMERYWCLRWLRQEKIGETTATVIRDQLVRFDNLPLVVRVPALKDVEAGERVRLALEKIDLWELTLHAEYLEKCEA